MKCSSLVLIAICLGSSVAAKADSNLKPQLAAATEAQDFSSVAEILRRQHADEPENIDHLKALAAAELNLGYADAAQSLLSKLALLVPAEDTNLLEMQGDLARQKKDYPAAVNAWQAALKSSPESVSLLSKLAQHFLYQDKNPTAAAAYFERLLPLRSSADDHIQVAYVAAMMRNWTVLVERTAALKMEFATDNNAKNKVPAFERLIQSITKVAELDAQEKTSDNPLPVILERCRLFIDVGVPNLALTEARRALKLAPEALHVRFHFVNSADKYAEWETINSWNINRSSSIRRVADLKKLAELDQALFANVSDPVARYERADLLYKAKQYRLAQADANLIAENPQALRIVALVQANDGYFAQAVANIDKATSAAPDDPLILAAASFIHERQGNYEHVIQLCDRWLKVDSNEKASKRRTTAIANLQK
jgi:tetratricopeptide (TPR) repeat protein